MMSATSWLSGSSRFVCARTLHGPRRDSIPAPRPIRKANPRASSSVIGFVGLLLRVAPCRACPEDRSLMVFQKRSTSGRLQLMSLATLLGPLTAFLTFSYMPHNACAVARGSFTTSSTSRTSSSLVAAAVKRAARASSRWSPWRLSFASSASRSRRCSSVSAGRSTVAYILPEN